MASEEADHLRPPPTSFVGREQEIAEVAGLMEGARLLTLTGPGGVGKTRLALAVSERLAPRVAGGATFVDLAPVRDPALVPAAVAQALGLRHAEDAAAAARHHLRDRSALLLLDNLEQVIAAAPFVAALLRACPRVRVLATSRAPLRVAGEQEYAVPPLALPPDHRSATGEELAGSEAVRLFVARARAVRPFLLEAEGSLSVVDEICRRLDGLPLAIELAAARLRAFAPAELLARLDRRLALLGDGARDAPARQRTLRATIDWSHTLLDCPARALFRRLAVFAGGWTLEAVEEVCADEELDRSEVVDALVGLVEQSLVVADAMGRRGRYRFLETIREYAAEELARSGEADHVRDRHLAWVACLAAAFEREWPGPRGTEWLDRFHPELENLRAALAWCRDGPGRAEAGLRLAADLTWFWSTQGRPSEGVEHVQAFLDAAPAPTLARGRALHSGAQLLSIYGSDGDRSRAWAEEALAIARAIGDPALIGDALGRLGVIAGNVGDYSAALAHLEEALPSLREVGGIALVNCLRNVGTVLVAAGDHRSGRAALEESLAVTRETGFGAGAAMALLRLGVLDRLDGHYAAARAHLEASRPLMEQWRFPSGRFWVEVALANLARAGGRLEEARARLFEQLRWATTDGDRHAVLHALCALGILAGLEGDHRRAVRLIGACSPADGLVGVLNGVDLRVEGQAALARARAALGEADYAATLAAGRAASLDELVATAWTQQPTARSAAAPVRARSADPLTSREREVSALVAHGRTNREIAEALVVSERTVESHVTNALAKLGFRTRAQIAAWAVAHGVVEAGGQSE